MDYPGEKLVIKMWETLTEKGIGGWLQPWHEKRLGKARNQIRREEILMLSEVEEYAAEIKAGRAIYNESSGIKLLNSVDVETQSSGRVEPQIDMSKLALRAIELEKAEGLRKEVNINKAILIAEDILVEDSQEPPNREIEDDWLFLWRDYAGKVSATELQDLWGRILAGEVKNPGSYSFRALEFLKSLDKEEAEIISKAAQFVVSGKIYRNKEKFLENEGINFNTLIFLQELGIVSGVEALGLETTFHSTSPDKYISALISNNKAILLEHEDVNKTAKAPVYLISTIGKQILGITNFGSNEDYLIAIAQDYIKQGYQVSIGDWVKITDTTGEIHNSKKVEASAVQ